MRKHGMQRRQLTLGLLGGMGLMHLSHGAAPLQDSRPYAPALASYQIRLPQDHGAHPDFRTEWWYFTGWFSDEGQKPGSEPSIGIQITFFRTAPRSNPANPLRMAPRQLLLAHVAVARREKGQLVHDQIARRSGLADTALSDTQADGRFEMQIGPWRLRRLSSGNWEADIKTSELMLQCEFKPIQGEWLQGDAGFSRKGPQIAQASHYITLPHMESRARLHLKNEADTRLLSGTTWMDHEWSSSVLDERAVGWDWVGLHGDDGSALMAFRIRGATNSDIWQHGSMRFADGSIKTYERVAFQTLDSWTSPRTGTVWPVSMRLQLDDDVYVLRPLMPDQELDSRLSTGTVYWEGAVRVLHKSKAGSDAGAGDTRPWGRGYLELTGYWKPMKL